MITKNISKIFFLFMVLQVSLLPYSVLAASLQDLNKQKEYYQQQAQDAQIKAGQKKEQAGILETEISKVNKNIDDVSGALKVTTGEIAKNEDGINSLSNQIDIKEKELTVEEEKLKETIASWYMEKEEGLLLTILSSNKISEITDKYEQFESLQQQLKGSADKVKQIKDNLVAEKDQLEKKKVDLKELKSGQIAQQNNLENQKQFKKKLLNRTESAVNDLINQEKSAQAKIVEIDQKIKTLSETKKWGDQIISSNESSWYHTQTGNYTKLGNSPYTVDQYGCLITSMAMVATRYGISITPSDIASTKGIFDDDGYLLVSSPPELGVTILPSKTINWDVVDEELSQNRPVIVSIYIPSVGKINQDGSSHFIVIKGKLDNKYLMHDPISGQRGYNLDQVRSMKLVRPS